MRRKNTIWKSPARKRIIMRKGKIHVAHPNKMGYLGGFATCWKSLDCKISSFSSNILKQNHLTTLPFHNLSLRLRFNVFDPLYRDLCATSTTNTTSKSSPGSSPATTAPNTTMSSSATQTLGSSPATIASQTMISSSTVRTTLSSSSVPNTNATTNSQSTSTTAVLATTPAGTP